MLLREDEMEFFLACCEGDGEVGTGTALFDEDFEGVEDSLGGGGGCIRLMEGTGEGVGAGMAGGLLVGVSGSVSEGIGVEEADEAPAVAVPNVPRVLLAVD